MTIRLKITLLITAAGFISSLVFSCIILWELQEQPLRMVDAELESTIEQAARIVVTGAGRKMPDIPCPGGDERCWLKIVEPESGRTLYRSALAKRVDLPAPGRNAGAAVSRTIPRVKVDQDQDRQNEVTFRVRAARVSLGNRTLRVIAALPVGKLEEELWDNVIGVSSGLAVSVLVLMAISYFFAGFILRPVRAINDQARDISEKHLDRRIPVSAGQDEFNALARTLNQVFDRLQHAFLRQKRLLADASHELKTPLTMMRLAVDEMHSACDPASSRYQAENLTRITEQVLRMERLVKSLLDLSSLEIEGAKKLEPLDVAVLLTALIPDYRFLSEPRRIRINARLPGQLAVNGDAQMLNRAFSNLLDNAVKYSEDGGQIEVTGTASENEVSITIGNSGQGVPASEISRVFDQFYRVEASRSLRYGGSGLGLAIVKRIVELHGGKIEFESRQGSWTQVTVSLPRCGETSRT